MLRVRGRTIAYNGAQILCRRPMLKLSSTNPTTLRWLHSSPSEGNGKMIEPILPQQSGQDGFEEMMDDRTNALLKTLGFDMSLLKQEALKQEGSELEKNGNQSPSSVLAAEKMVPLVAAIDVSSRPVGGRSQHARHIFDTQEVYAELRSAGLTSGQAEVIMRTMLELIDDLVQTTKKRSVPIAAGANEAYLFDAASSEVRNEIQNSRQVQSTAYRSGLARLQRDVEILEHEATEITSLLKSDLDIEVHERKNSARAEENVIQLKIQDLHNKIATRLNSELKSEIENLRWQITRRSLAAIAVIAASIIWLTQKNTSTKTAKNQVRQRQTSALKESPTVAVPILSPSVSEESEYSGHSVFPIDDLATLVPSSVDPVTHVTHGNSSDGDKKDNSGDNESITSVQTDRNIEVGNEQTQIDENDTNIGDNDQAITKKNFNDDDDNNNAEN